jgi:hypothetical protein
MENKNISVGDLVQVSKPTSCCGKKPLRSPTFVVASFVTGISAYCRYCGSDVTNHTTVKENLSDKEGWDLSMLVKIAGPAEEIAISTEKEKDTVS